jgi:hypothetical protein
MRYRLSDFTFYIGLPPYERLAYIVTHPDGRRLRFRSCAASGLRERAAAHWGEDERDPAVFERYLLAIDQETVNMGADTKRRRLTTVRRRFGTELEKPPAVSRDAARRAVAALAEEPF